MTRKDTLDPYFADEEACFLGVLDRAVAEVHACAAAAAHGQEGWGRQTYAALRALLGALVADRPVAWIALIEAPNAGAAATARYEELGDAAVAWLCRGRQFYPAAADLPDGFERMVVDGVAFLLRRRLLDSADLAMPALADEITLYILEPIVGQAEFRRLASELGRSAWN
jgi:hypothetical protein